MCFITKKLFKEKQPSISKLLHGKYKYSQKKTSKAYGSNKSFKDEIIGNQSKETRPANESHHRRQTEKKCLEKSEDFLGEIEEEYKRKEEKVDNKFDNERQNLYRQEINQPENNEKKNLDRLSPAETVQQNRNESSRCNIELNAHVGRNCMAGSNICNFHNRHKNVVSIESIHESEFDNVPGYMKIVESDRDNAMRFNETIYDMYTEYPNEFYAAGNGSQQLVNPCLLLEQNTVYHRNKLNLQSQQTPDSLNQSGVHNQSKGILRDKKFDRKHSFGNNSMDYHQKIQSENFNRKRKHPNTISKAKMQNHQKLLAQQYSGSGQKLEYNRTRGIISKDGRFERIHSTQFYPIKKSRSAPVGSIHFSAHHYGLGDAPGPSILEQTSLATSEAEHSAKHLLKVVSAHNRDKYVTQSRDLDNKAVFSDGNIWSEDVENAFLEAITIYPLSG
ncbi:MAG: hypothetical protein MHMPM18_004578, partial [Marteilia pararefringens]